MAYKDILFEMEIKLVASWRHFHRSMTTSCSVEILHLPLL